MHVVQGSAQLPDALTGGIITMGNFDGVHRGHASIITAVVRTAKAMHAPGIVYTFDPHPAKVLAPTMDLPMLQTLTQRLHTLEALGVTGVIVEPFTQTFAAMTAAEFLEAILATRLQPSALIIGYDFTFGCHRAGRTSDLSAYGAAREIPCTIVEPLFVGEVLISSSYLRKTVAAGRMTEATAGIGRPYGLEGTIVRGHGLGKALGFPTLNLMPKNALIPPSGVYVTTATLDATRARTWPAATYIGSRPTFGGTAQVVETYLLSAPMDISATTMEVAFHKRLRGDVRFDSAEALQAQIASDVAQAQAFHGA
jgi:riboflavin kinase / FMN adenylyltransferase